MCHENNTNVFTSHWAVFDTMIVASIDKRVVIMTHQNLSFGMCWKLFWATLSAPMIEFSICIMMFLNFRTKRIFPRYLAKFQSITKIKTYVFGNFISENLRPPLIFRVPSLGWEVDKMTSFTQQYRTGWNCKNN